MSTLPTLAEIEAAAALVRTAVPTTPQFSWPMLNERVGCEVWVKHENHTPLGAFKVRGGLVYFARLVEREPGVRGVIAATRGNHGQSVAFAARRHGLTATIVVPHGNSVEKNAAMRTLGAEPIEHGEDFQAAREHAEALAAELGLHMVPSFHERLVAGVATGSLELLAAAPELDVVYVPIGLGSGICGMLAAREALGLRTEVVGVVSTGALAYAVSFAERRAVERPVTTRLSDGMAVRVPQPEALELIWRGVSRIVAVSDEEVGEAMRALFECTHNIAEGAGAAPLAAALKERDEVRGRQVGLVLSGGNVDRSVFARVLAEKP